MAQPQNEKPKTTQVAVDGDAFLEAIKELKRPYVDPAVAERKARDRERIKRQCEENVATKQAREAACAHRREDNTSAIAWMTNSDLVTRGACQRCNRLVTPADADYMALIAVPDRAVGMVI